jgi:hypothetical protein
MGILRCLMLALRAIVCDPCRAAVGARELDQLIVTLAAPATVLSPARAPSDLRTSQDSTMC